MSSSRGGSPLTLPVAGLGCSTTLPVSEQVFSVPPEGTDDRLSLGGRVSLMKAGADIELRVRAGGGAGEKAGTVFPAAVGELLPGESNVSVTASFAPSELGTTTGCWLELWC